MKSALALPIALISSPRLFFERLRERWPWFPAYVLAVLCNLAGLGLTLPGAGAQLSGVLQHADMATNWMMVALVIGIVLGSVLAPLAIVFAFSFAAAVMGLFYHRHPNFSKVYSLTMWCFFPTFTVGTLVRGVLTFMRPELYPSVTLSPAVFVTPEMVGLPIHRILVTLDVFQVLFYCLFALGYSIVTKLPIRKSAIVSGGMYVLQVLFTLALTTS